MNGAIGSKILHHVFRSAILLGFAFYILYLVRYDKILYYIAPRMIDYVKWSAIGLYAIGIYQAYLALVTAWTRKSADCACEELPSFRLKTLLIYGIFVLPLVLGVVIPDSTLGSAMASKKGVKLQSSDRINNGGGEWDAHAGDWDAHGSSPAAGEQDLDKLFPSDSFNESFAALAKKLYRQNPIEVKDELFMETLSSVDLYVDVFTGKTIELSGFVFREEGLESNRFILARFALQCCSADAAPYGVMIEYDRAPALADDTWVKVAGPISKVRYHDMDIMIVKAERIEKIPPPKSSYVYPNPDF